MEFMPEYLVIVAQCGGTCYDFNEMINYNMYEASMLLI